MLNILLKGAGKLFTIVLVVLSFNSAFGQNQKITAFVNVNVIPMDKEQVLERQTVLIVDDRIAKMGSMEEIEIPLKAKTIDGEGAFLLPGLADMHIHLRDTDSRHLQLYLAQGVTVVRNLGSAPNALTWKQLVEDGKIVGPTITTTGPAINGLPPGKEWGSAFYFCIITLLPLLMGILILILVLMAFRVRHIDFSILPGFRKLSIIGLGLLIVGGSLAWSRAIPFPVFIGLFAPSDSVAATPVDAEYIVNKQYSQGFRNIKLYDWIDNATFLAATREAKALGLYTIGHASDQIPIETVLDSGMDEIAHIDELLSYFWIDYDSSSIMSITDLPFYKIDHSKLDKVVSLVKKSGTRVTPTLVTDENMYLFLEDSKKFYSNPAFQVIRPELLQRWKSKGRIVNWKGQEDYRRNQMQPFLKKMTKALQEAGVPILLGTDAMVTSLIPGYHIHRELEILVEAGFSPYEALVTGTINAALATEEMGEDGKWGAVAIGNRADLVLLEKNPLVNISNTRNRVGVMVRGKWYRQTDLDKSVREYINSFGIR